MLRTGKIIRPLLTLLAGSVVAATLAACGPDDDGGDASGTDAATTTATTDATTSDSDGTSSGATSAAPGTTAPAGAGQGAPPAGGGQPSFVPGKTPNLQPSTMTIKNWQGVDLCGLLTPADIPPVFGDLGGPAQRLDDMSCGFLGGSGAGVIMGVLTLNDLVGESEWADPSTVQGYSLDGNDAWVSCGTDDQTCLSYVMVDSGNAFGVVAGVDGMSQPDLQATVVSLLQVAFDRLPNA